MKSSSWLISSPLYPCLSSTARNVHLANVVNTARPRNPKNKRSRVVTAAAYRDRKNRIKKSTKKELNPKSVMTWKMRPAMARSTPTVLDPDDEAERLPPMPWRIRDVMSQGRKTQMKIRVEKRASLGA